MAEDCVRVGDTGRSVDTLHELLYMYGFGSGTEEQWVKEGQPFDAVTQQAVKYFQTAYGLSPDGVVGEDTWAAFNFVGKKCSPVASYRASPTSSLPVVSSGQSVAVPIHQKKWFIPVAVTSVLGVAALIVFWPKK